MPPFGDEARLDDDEFVVPEDPVEQECFKRRLMATASSLKKKQQQLRADQDLLADKWTEVLAAEEYERERPSKSYPKRKLLPQLEEEAYKPTSPAHNTADRHLVAATESPLGPPLKPHPGIARKVQSHGGMRRTCETYWRIRQDNQDRSTDRVGAPRYATTTVTPDTAIPAVPNTVDKACLSCIVI